MRARTWLLAALLLPSPAPPASAPPPAAAPQTSPKDLLSSLKTAWEARDQNAYLALWNFPNPEARAAEQSFAQGFGQWQQAAFLLEGMGSRLEDGGRIRAATRSFSRSEPRAREDEYVFTLEKGDGGWRIVQRESVGAIDGLAHLALDPQGYVARGHVLRLEDFELRMDEGTIFISQHDVGPTLLIFVGKGSVKITPRPITERKVLEAYCGRQELTDEVHAAFVRVHPADLHRVLNPVQLDPDPKAGDRLSAAREVFETEANHSFVLDADLPGSPWWVFPGIGDALITFRAAHQGTLTFAVFSADQEAISLFDRVKKRQICLYPTEGRDIHYNEDQGREAAIVSHRIKARFDLDHGTIDAEDTVHLRLLSPSHTVRFRLDDGLRVRSITSEDSGQHPFFRVRDQDTVMVSLGAASGTTGDIALKVSYTGPYRSGALDSEAQTVRGGGFMDTSSPDVTLDRPTILTSKYPWYPQMNASDYAVATVIADIPASHRAVTSGTLISEKVEAGRRLVEYSLNRPGKYLAIVIAHLVDGGQVDASGVAVRAFLAPRTKQVGRQLLQNTQEILAFYTKEFGPSPYPFLNLVVVESENGGGHSPPGMVLLAERPLFVKSELRDDPGNFSDIRTFFLAHELAHQWWGHGVAGANYHERWLSEGFAQYAAALWVREKYGEEAFQGVLRRLALWAERDNATGPISLGYRLSQVGTDPRVFRAIVYDKGAYVLFMLRALVGDEPLRQALQTLQSRYRFQKIGTPELEAAIQEASGRDVKAYVEEWVYGLKLPSVKVSQRTTRAGRGFHTVVTLEGRDVPGPLPVDVVLTTQEGDKSTHVTLSDRPASWTVETNSAPKKVRVNPDRALLLRVENGERP